MADNPTVVATPYPTYMTGGDDDDSFRAALISHGNASVERNQDSQFSAQRDQHVTRDVLKTGRNAEVATLENRYELATRLKDSEVRMAEGLARIEAKLDAQTIASLTRDLGEAKAQARQDATAAILATILAKLPSV